MKPKTNTDPMQEAYKLLDGTPSATAVSDAAKGQKPETDFKDFRDEEQGQVARRNGLSANCLDIQEAYAMLFESLAVIMKSK